MIDFFARVAPQTAPQIERLARLQYELREHRRALLQRHGAADEDDLMRLMREGRLPEHPGYDDWLAACVLQDTRDAVAAELRALLVGGGEATCCT
jgi:hypothetical protein